MAIKQKELRGYMVSVHPIPEMPEAIRVSNVPRGIQQEKESGGVSKQVSEFSGIVRPQGSQFVVAWDKPPSDAPRSKLEEDARNRLRMRLDWLQILADLMDSAQRWGKELDWSTRCIEKEMKDAEIGDYQAPALLLQKELTRALLEPVGRSAPGAEGVVDLYLLPGYDDIATLYYHDGQWNLHYLTPETPAGMDLRQAEARPLTKATLRRVLEQMKQHAA
jgi:hypothetical protein